MKRIIGSTFGVAIAAMTATTRGALTPDQFLGMVKRDTTIIVR